MKRRTSITALAAALACALACAGGTTLLRHPRAAEPSSNAAPTLGSNAETPPSYREDYAAAAAAADRPTRARSIAQAAAVGDAEAVRWLADVASHDPELAETAAAAIGHTANPHAVPSLRDLVGGSGTPIVRANAARAFGKSGSPADNALLSEILTRPDELARVRVETALAMGGIGDASAVPTLAATLRTEATNDSSDAMQLRIAVVQSLGAIGGDRAHAALEEHAARNMSPTERAFTARALKARRGTI